MNKNLLTIGIPIYNAAPTLPETLHSIISQPCFNQVELLIVDGASTDSTPSIIRPYLKQYPNMHYHRLSQKGGIDQDMAITVEQASHDYCWIFSGDDWMLPNVLPKILELIQTNQDLYLAQHYEWWDDTEWRIYPTVNKMDDHPKIFELSHPRERIHYFAQAITTEAFFSFCGGIIVKKSTWLKVPIEKKFIGSCWAHVARFFELMRHQLSVKVLSEPYLKRRPDNDSFMNQGLIQRWRLTIDGYQNLANYYFGQKSIEAQHIRRVLRYEYHPLLMRLGKYLCYLNPQQEDRALLNRLLKTTYCDLTLHDLKTRFMYYWSTPGRFEKEQRLLSLKFKEKYTVRF